MSEIKIEDIRVGGSTWHVSLLKLVGKKVKDLRGMLSAEFGDVVFDLTTIVFEDDTEMGVDGEHDIAYVIHYDKYPQPNYDDETLSRLYDEENSIDGN